jgi:hypothetical protein
MTTEEVLALINNDPDFIHVKRFDFSMAKLLERFPDGAPDRTIAQALMITPDDVQRIYDDIVERLKVALADP